jgi:hypothetical protein
VESSFVRRKGINGFNGKEYSRQRLAFRIVVKVQEEDKDDYV